MGNKKTLLFASIAITGFILSEINNPYPLIILNRTESVPKGLYRLTEAPLEHGALVAYQPTFEENEWLYSNRIIGKDWVLLKHIAALGGDTVCIRGDVISVHGKPMANTWYSKERYNSSVCETLKTGDIFLLNRHPKSVDGRYFGIQKQSQIIGVVRPIWTWGRNPEILEPGEEKVLRLTWNEKVSRRARLKHCRTHVSKPLSAHLFLCDSKAARNSLPVAHTVCDQLHNGNIGE